MAPRSERALPRDEPNAKPLDGVAIRRLLALARPAAGPPALGILFLFLGSISNLFYPKGLQFVVDEVLNKKRFDLINQMAEVGLVLFAIQAIAIAVRYYLSSTSGERIVTKLRDAVYRSLMRQEVAFFDARKTG